MRRFLVTSPGYTATKWLAWALDQAPGVLCNHSAGHDASDAEAYDLETLAQLAGEKHGPRDEEPVPLFLEALERRGRELGATAVGNVHRYSLTALRKNEARFGLRHGATVVNVVRHPVPWLESGAAQLGRMMPVSDVVRRRLQRHSRRFAARYHDLRIPRDPWPADLAFCYLCGRLRRLVAEAADGARHVRMEDLTSEGALLADVFRELTGRTAESSWLERVQERGRVHRHRAVVRSPAEQLAAWEPWKQRVFEDWARQTDLAGVYAELGYSVALPKSRPRPVTRPSVVPPCGTSTIERAMSTGLRRIPAAPIRWTRLLEPRLRRVLDEVTRRLESRGLPRLAGRQRWAPMSPGLAGGVSPQLGACGDHEGWRVSAAHPVTHDRSPAVHCQHRASGVQHVLSYKGAGLRSPDDSFVVRGARSPRYGEALERGVRKPIDVLFDRPPGDWRSHELVGGARLIAALFEARYALGWHALLLAHDGEPAATCVPLRMWRPRAIEVVVGESRRLVSLWASVTDPELVVRAQYDQVARDVFPGLESLPIPRAVIGRLFVLRKAPVIYEHATRAKLRVGHLWTQLNDEEALQARARETETTVTDVIAAWLDEVFASNGKPWRRPPMDAATPFEFVASAYRHNRKAADVLLSEVGHTAGRTLGALHGSGGHCLGRRLKIRTPEGHERFDASGLPLRAGAPGGGCCAPRNVTVAGELVDTTHVFNPRFDPVSRLAAVGSRYYEELAWADPSQARRFQRADLRLAELSMAMLDAVVIGDRTLVPEGFDRLQTLRHRRRRLEDHVRGDPSDEVLRRELAEVECEATELRKRLPDAGGSVCRSAFREAYEEHRRRASDQNQLGT